jgi:hypothetical protein
MSTAIPQRGTPASAPLDNFEIALRDYVRAVRSLNSVLDTNEELDARVLCGRRWNEMIAAANSLAERMSELGKDVSWFMGWVTVELDDAVQEYVKKDDIKVILTREYAGLIADWRLRLRNRAGDSEFTRTEDASKTKGSELRSGVRGLAKALGVEAWHEIEMKVLATGIIYRRLGSEERFLRRGWGGLGMKGAPKRYGMLIEIAKHGGTFPPRRGERRWAIVHDLNNSFREAFGLDENPFRNARKMGTQSIIGSLTWGGRV